MSKGACKDKEKSIQEKLKHFFGFNKEASSPQVGQKPKLEEFILTPEIIKDVSCESPLNHRLKTIKELCEIVLMKHLEDYAVESLCTKTSDLLQPQQTVDTRHNILCFYSYLIQGQYEKMTIIRSYLFRLIRHHNILEDLGPRLDVFKSLTLDGKSILYFEEEAGPFLLEWMPDAINAGTSTEFLQILVNVIKYNAAYLDEDVISGLVQHTCTLSIGAVSDEEVQLCLEVLDAVICYSHLPSSTLPNFIISLCHTVNVEKLSQLSWKLVRNLLGTSLGHTGIYTMCHLLQDRKDQEDYVLLKGAVFFIGTSLWGSKSVPTLTHPPSAVLPSFLMALDCGHTTVAYEVVISVQRLVKNCSDELRLTTWDIILDVVEKLLCFKEVQNPSRSKSILATSVHDLITLIEHQYEKGTYKSSVDRLFSLIESCANNRPEESVLRLVQYRTQALHIAKEKWITELNHIMESYFRNEVRPTVRTKALDILSGILNTSRHLYEEDIIDQTVLPLLTNLDEISDVAVRKAAVNLLVDVAENCTTKHCLDILDIIEKVICRPFEHFSTRNLESSDTVCIVNEDEVSDVRVSVIGLISIFEKKLYLLPSSHAVRAYTLLINHIQDHYTTSVVFEETSTIRKVIVEFLLRLRTNSSKQLGIADNEENVEYSVYLLCASQDSSSDRLGSLSPPISSSSSSSLSSSSSAVSFLSLNQAFQVIIKCLKREKDWIVLQLVLNELPKMLQNKALVVCAKGYVSSLCSCLCSMVVEKDNGLPETLRNTPQPRFTRSDFNTTIFPALAALVAYHKELEHFMQNKFIKCLQFGLVTKCSRICIEALTLCTLEMRDMMLKLLPSVLLNLSKISATVGIAIPILEFLSNLIRLPPLYVSFVEDQYMSIFAIALPYTNPFKFNQYSVALAHHVIAMWFLKCRIPFRKDFVRFITKGLRTNIFQTSEENANLSQSHGIGNDDSVQRRRSSSLNDASGRSDARVTFNSTTMTLHTELLETCIDLMARFTFGMCSNVPRRSSVGDFLLEKGQSSRWCLGNKVITITTSGCGTKAFKNGLCEKCFMLCRPDKDKNSEAETGIGSASTQNVDLLTKRRRHRSAIQGSSSNLSNDFIHRSSHLTKDDMDVGERHNQFPWEEKNERRRPLSPLNRESLISVNKGSTCEEYEEQYLDNLCLGIADKEKDTDKTSQLCCCWCTGWAEVFIRRPTGNVSWMMRIQNSLFLPTSPPDLFLPDIASLILPAKEESFELHNESYDDNMLQQMLENHLDNSQSELESQEDSSHCKDPPPLTPQPNAPSTILAQGSISPLRRTNSSPAMQVNWSNFSTLEPIHQREPQEEECKKEKLNLPVGVGGSIRHALNIDSSSKNEKNDQTAPCAELVQQNEDEENNLIQSPMTEQKSSPDDPNKSPVRKSPRKEDRYNSIPEEPKNSEKEECRKNFHLIFANVSDTLQDSQKPSSPLPSHSFGSLASFSKAQSPPHSPFGRKSAHRDRGHTISSPGHSKPSGSWTTGNRSICRSGMNPSFVFLQLYHNSCFGPSSEKPLLLTKSELVNRTIELLDHIPPYDTHKIGVIYVGPGQANNEAAILNNQFGSLRYVKFLRGLGTLIKLSEIDAKYIYTGGLHLHGEDGKFALVWHDDVMQVIFHTATLMPNKPNDRSGNSKKLHIANNFVIIVYNESGEDYSLSTIKGQFMFACVVIRPEDYNSNVVTVKVKPDLLEIFGHAEPYIVSDESLPIFARQLALHANLASMILQRQQSNHDPYVSNWLERLRHIKRLRCRILQESSLPDESVNTDVPGGSSDSTRQQHTEDFTDYV